MIRFKNISIKNFLSYGSVPTIVELDKPGTTMILGEDLDNTSSGTGANGVGKTAIINALVYAIYDKALSNISKDNLVNNINKKNMEVSLTFDINSKVYQITRTRKTKAGAAGNNVTLLEDGKDITPDSVANTNALIERIMGIPFDLFVRIVTFSATLIPFLDLPVRSPTAANQTDIIEELFDLKTLSEKATLLKEKIKEAEQSLNINLTRVEQIKKEHERHNTQLESARRRVSSWTDQNQNEIEALEGKLKKIENVNVDEQRGLHKELKDLNVQLRESSDSIDVLEQKIKEHIKHKADKTKELSHLQDAKCPYCLQQYKDAAGKIKECKDDVRKDDITIKGFTKSLESETEMYNGLVDKHEELSSKIVVKDIDSLIEIVNKSSHYQQKIEELLKARNPFDEPLQELLDIELDPLDMTTVNELKLLIDHQKFLLKLLTKKDSFVRKALLNKNIPFLNQRLSHYLTALGLPHTVEFTHEMTAGISQFGRPMDFGNLSNGQRARVNIALSFAFRDVLQSLYQTINVCLLDEVLDVGLDTVGVQAAAKMLKRKARDEKIALFIISHRDEIDSAFDRKMMVQISKGFSYIRYEES